MHLSILIPVYNVERYFDECLRSVLAACEPGDEVILVNDGSTDTSGALCDAAATAHPGLVRVIHQANAGLSAARNQALAHAAQDVICFLDSDDVLCADTLQQARALWDETQPDVMVCDAARWREGQPDEPLRHTLPPRQPVPPHQALLATWHDNFLSSCCRLYSKRLLDKLGPTLFPPGQSYEDNSIVPTIMAEAQRVVYLPMPLFRYRIRPGSITQEHRLSRCLDHARSLASPLAHLATQGHPQDVQMAANLAALHHIVIAVRHAATIKRLTTRELLSVIQTGTATLTLSPADILNAAHTSPHGKPVRKHARSILQGSRLYAAQRVLLGRWKRARQD
ncbi:MAG: hypothetical protein RI907_3508 [Pseudomonadota bacterium]